MSFYIKLAKLLSKKSGEQLKLSVVGNTDAGGKIVYDNPVKFKISGGKQFSKFQLVESLSSGRTFFNSVLSEKISNAGKPTEVEISFNSLGKKKIVLQGLASNNSVISETALSITLSESPTSKSGPLPQTSLPPPAAISVGLGSGDATPSNQTSSPTGAVEDEGEKIKDKQKLTKPKVEIVYPPKPVGIASPDGTITPNYFQVFKGEKVVVEIKVSNIKFARLDVDDGKGGFTTINEKIDFLKTKKIPVVFDTEGLRTLRLVGLSNTNKEVGAEDKVTFSVKEKSVLEFITPIDGAELKNTVQFLLAWKDTQPPVGVKFLAEGIAFGNTDKVPIIFDEYDEKNKRWTALFEYDFKVFGDRIITAEIPQPKFSAKKPISKTVKIKVVAGPKKSELIVPAAPPPIVDKKSLTQTALEQFQEELKAEDYILKEAIKAGKTVAGPIRLDNAQNYDLTKLRFVENNTTSGLLNDPIAFMTNQVWDYFLLSKNNIAFDYRNPTMEKYANSGTLLEARKYYKKFYQSFIDEKYEKGTKQYNTVVDKYYQISISKTLVSFIKKDLPGQNIDELAIPLSSGKGNFDAHYPLFWSWIKHIFTQHVEIMQHNPDIMDESGLSNKRIRIVTRFGNYIPLQTALYFLEKKYSLSGPEADINENISDLIVDWNDNLNSQPPKLELSEKVFNYTDPSTTGTNFLNQNNYIFKNKNPVLSSNPIVQIDNSVFFAQNEATLSPSEEKLISNLKKVKACKEVSDNKKETSLRLFYKEGNDNILDKDLPEPGLGCTSALKEWDQAKLILFSASSLHGLVGQRFNFTLPYMNEIVVVGKQTIPKELDLHKVVINSTSLKDSFANKFKQLSTYLLKSDTKTNDDDNILIDNSLLDKKLDETTEENFIVEKNKGFKTKIIDNNLKYVYDKQKNPNWAVEYSPYLGVFNYGYQITKTNKVDNNSTQDYFINLFENKSGKLPSILDSDTPYEYSDQNIRIYDSQIKYAAGYIYDLYSLYNFINIGYEYDYMNVSSFNVGKPYKNALKKLLQEAAKNLQEKFDNNKGILPEDLKDDIKKFAELNDAYKKASDGPAQRYYYVDYGLGSKKYKNDREKIKTSTVDSGVSYIELPPTALFMKVFPLRGVNNRLLLSFDNYSFKKAVIKEKIPKKYWSSDWEKTKKFFVESFKDLNDEQKAVFGIDNTEPADDEMYFTRAKIEKIQIYYSEGKKPKDLSEMEKFLDPIMVAQEGFTKEISLKPNTKYYFSAKAVSFVDLESAFSQVYEVELVDADGAVFTTVDIVDLTQKKMKRKDKMSLTNKFRVEPALLQQAPNPEKNKIGYLSPSVFSPSGETKPQFKIRLTSKKTGRKVDFNIIYKQNFVKDAGTTAGNLSLYQAKKDNVLISYFNQSTSTMMSLANTAFIKKKSFSADETIMSSPNDNYYLIFQADGNLVLIDATESIWKPLWDTGTFLKPNQGKFISFQGDGNLVIYKDKPFSAENSVWSSNTSTQNEENKPEFLVLDNKGVLSLRNKNAKLIKILYSTVDGT